MTPFGVRVVVIVTGSIDTNVFTKSDEVILPAESYYIPAAGQLIALAKGGSVKTKMSASTYADRVVSDVINGANGKVWRGTFSSLARYAAWVLPAGIQVSFHTFIRGSRSVLISLQDHIMLEGSGLDKAELQNRS